MISYKNVYGLVMTNIKYPPVIKVCLFCKLTNNSFRQKEHPFQESLGNTRIVLPPGVVCDKCNNYFSKLENDFINTNPVFFWRCFLPITTKKGNPPKVILPKGSIYRREPNSPLELPTICIQQTCEKEELERIATEFRPDASEYSLPPIQLPHENIQRSSRVLAKIALELLCLYDYPRAFSPAFDTVRNFARYAPQERQGQYIPYAWNIHAGQSFIHRLIEIRIGLETTWNVYAFFTLPGVQYLYPLSPPNLTPSFSFLAEQMNLMIETQRERSETSYLTLNIQRVKIT